MWIATKKMENSAIFALMKSYSLIGILLLWLLASCKQAPTTIIGGQMLVSASDTALSLAGVDSVMQQWPDSALTLLLDCRDGVHTVSTEPTDRHYYELLLAEALYKNDSAQANRKELQQAMAYYDSLCSCKDVARNASTIAFLDARAHYMNGVGYYENDSTVEACKEYMKALDVMESHFDEKELIGHKARFMAMVYSHLTSLFSDLYLQEQCIFFAKAALKHYSKYGAPSWHPSWILTEIGIQHEILENLDSAEYYFQKATETLNDTNCLSYRDIASLCTYLSYRKDHNPQLALERMYGILAQAENDKEYYSRSSTIGEIFYLEKQYDSAWVYLCRIYENSQFDDIKKQAAERLLEICKTQGRDSEILEYANYLAPYANQLENHSAMRSQLIELYNTFRQKALERQYQQIIIKNSRRTVALLFGLLIFMVAIVVLFHHKDKRSLRQLKSESLGEVQNHFGENSLEHFLAEPLCQEILHSIVDKNIKRSATPADYPELVLNESQLQQLALVVNRYFGSFESQLEQRGLTSNPVLVNLCHLYLLGMDEKQTAILLNRDYSSIKRYEKKLKNAFETQENMVSFLRNHVSSI